MNPASGPRRHALEPVTLGHRIRLALAFAAIVPVLMLGVLAVRAAREELSATVGGALVRQAAGLASACEHYTLDRLRGLRQTASYLPFDRLTRQESGAALAIPYRQSPELQILVLLRADGTPAADPAYQAHPELDAELAGHEPVDAAALEAFGRSVPLEVALRAGLAVGPPYLAAGSGLPRVALAVRVGERGDRVLAAEFSLAEVKRWLAESAGAGAAALLDPSGKVLASTDQLAVSAEEQALHLAGAAAAGPLIRVVERSDGRAWLAGFAPVTGLGWGVVVAQPADEAFRAIDRVRRQTAVWATVALALALALGFVLERALTRPVRRLTDAAAALTAGRFDAPLPTAGADELGTLAGAFAHMTEEVQRRDHEIRGWNAELQARVDRNTAELKAAADQVARTRRLTALGSLSAGVAQGLNDPLTSVVGLISLARREVGEDSPAGRQLGTALEEARRVTRVVHDLRHLAAPGRLEGARRFQLGGPVAAALDRRRAALAAAGVELHLDLASDLPDLEGDPEQLEALVGRLLDNAVAAMPAGGRLTVATAVVDGSALRLVVGDTGHGIPASLRERIFDPFFTAGGVGGAGLGLTLAHGIVEAHHGQIQVESEEGRGTTFTIHFPAAAGPARLA